MLRTTSRNAMFRERGNGYYGRRATMLTVSTRERELTDVWFESDPEHKRVRVTFPINKFAGAEETAVVYFEVQPGDRLATHTDSAEEVLYIVSGEADAQVGEERGTLRAGDLAVIPAMVPHGLVNLGEEPVRVVGFFSEAEITSTFEEPIQPIGLAALIQGAPAPA
jgi:quercetin dioxygenase-like cupin family protein